jgi:lipopolysaccharide biosynthesis glycosyltransferase
MIALTIASDLAYLRLAFAAAKSVRWSTGLEAEVVRHYEDSPAAFRKLAILDEYRDQTVLYFDADTRFLQRWDVSGYDDRPYVVAVRDVGNPEAIAADCRRYKLQPEAYLNTGLWIANQRHAEAWQLADQIRQTPDYKTAFQYEQTALNAAIQQQQTPVLILDRRYNWTCDTIPPPDSVVIHCAGGSLHSRPNRPIFERMIRERALRS